jgi:WD40 repeat protein
MSSQAPIPKLMDTLDCYYKVNSVAFHPTEPLLATGSSNRTELWKLKKKNFSLFTSSHNSSYNWSATCVSTIGEPHNHVHSVAFHPTAPLLATSSWDHTTKLWLLDYQNFHGFTCVATLEEHNNWVLSVSFHPIGKLLATGSFDNTAKLWWLSPDNRSATCVATLQHSDHVFSVAFHPTAPILATGSHDNTAKLWRFSPDGSTATCVATLAGHSGSVASVAFHPNGTVLATGSSDNTTKLWMVDQIINDILAEPAFSFGFQKNLLNLYSVFITINKPTLLSDTETYNKILESLPEKKTQILDHLDHRNRLLMITRARMCAMFVQKLLISYTTGPPIDILKFATAILSRRPRISSATCAATLQGHSGPVSSVAFHPTAPLLATGSLDKTAKLWQLNYQTLSNSTCVASLGHMKYVNSVAFHPTEPLLATGGDDGKAKLWKIKDLLLHIARAPQRGGAIIRHHKKRLSRKVKRYASKRIKKNINININKYRKSKKTKAKTKTRRYRKIK